MSNIFSQSPVEYLTAPLWRLLFKGRAQMISFPESFLLPKAGNTYLVPLNISTILPLPFMRLSLLSASELYIHVLILELDSKLIGRMAHEWFLRGFPRAPRDRESSRENSHGLTYHSSSKNLCFKRSINSLPHLKIYFMILTFILYSCLY